MFEKKLYLEGHADHIRKRMLREPRGYPGRQLQPDPAATCPTVEPVTTLALDTPAGLVRVDAEVRDGKVTRVTFENVPASAVHLDELVGQHGGTQTGVLIPGRPIKNRPQVKQCGGAGLCQKGELKPVSQVIPSETRWQAPGPR